MILLDHVTKTYPGDEEPALDNVSLHIESHEFVFLVGKSGAGKSTLIKMMTKEEHPDSGKIIIGGIDLDYVKRRHVPHYRRRLGVVFQDFKLLPMRTVYENVAFALEIAGMSNREITKTVPKVLDLVGLSHKAKNFPNQLSGGERQRVSIARSVARQPKILIADEPTGSLDPVTSHEIIELLQKINDFGTTILVTTHNENIVNSLSKRVITLEDGRIIDDQKMRGVYHLGNDTELPFEAPTEKLIIKSRYDTPRTAIPRSQSSQNRLVSSMQTNVRIQHDHKLNRKPTNTKITNPKAKTITSKTAVKPTQSSKPAKKYDRDSANQWYAASKPLKAAPKLSNLGPGQTVKLKPAPSLRQAIRPLPKSPKSKQVI